jgi:transcriptional regulator with XRE-family HTH domain
MFSASSSTDERWLWARLLGRLIRGARERRELSIQQAAERTGMTAAQWEGLEAGQVPGTDAEMAAIIQALEVPRDAVPALVVFYLDARGLKRGRTVDLLARRTHSRISSPREGGEGRSNNNQSNSR